MKCYNIYAGPFGNVEYLYTIRCENKQEAEAIAKKEAVNIYHNIYKRFRLIYYKSVLASFNKREITCKCSDFLSKTSG